MTFALSSRLAPKLDAEALRAIADVTGIPYLDLLLIMVNIEGVSGLRPAPRARMQLKPFGQSEVWQIIAPDAPESPFAIRDNQLFLSDEAVAGVLASENDDVVLTYVRAGGRSLTLNTHSRSTCAGCVFCPNVIEDAADSTLNGIDAFMRLLEWTCADNEWPNLSEVEVITVCSGCFGSPDAAIAHLASLRQAAKALHFTGRLHLLSSVVRKRDDLQRLMRLAGPFHLTLTLECFSRRDQLLKATKASLDLDAACTILAWCRELGIVGDFTYIAGLDPLAISVDGLLRLSAHATTFPRIQVYQAHNDYMRLYREADASKIEYYTDLRNSVQHAYAERGMRPRSWENYRPLWYTDYCGGPVGGPRI